MAAQTFPDQAAKASEALQRIMLDCRDRAVLRAVGTLSGGPAPAAAAAAAQDISRFLGKGSQDFVRALASRASASLAPLAVLELLAAAEPPGCAEQRAAFDLVAAVGGSMPSGVRWVVGVRILCSRAFTSHPGTCRSSKLLPELGAAAVELAAKQDEQVAGAPAVDALDRALRAVSVTAGALAEAQQQQQKGGEEADLQTGASRPQLPQAPQLRVLVTTLRALCLEQGRSPRQGKHAARALLHLDTLLGSEQQQQAEEEQVRTPRSAACRGIGDDVSLPP